jgi:hypothetical protein
VIDGARGAALLRELTPQLRRNQLDELGVAADVGGGERARRDDRLAARADLLERRAYKDAAESLALVAARNLGVGDDHTVAGRPIFGDPDKLSVEVKFETARGRVVSNRRNWILYAYLFCSS